jgi:site-specific recombinase XerD
VTLTAEGVRFFEQLTVGRDPDAFIFLNRHGRPWAIDGHVRVFAEAVARAGIPTETVAYNLRHAHIAHCIVHGMPADLVARNCGTSLEQIAKHYSKWSSQARQQALEAAAPRLGIIDSNVIALRA